MEDPEVFKKAEVIAFQALITVTGLLVVIQVICGGAIDALFDIRDKWCDKVNKRKNKDKEPM